VDGRQARSPFDFARGFGVLRGPARTHARTHARTRARARENGRPDTFDFVEWAGSRGAAVAAALQEAE